MSANLLNYSGILTKVRALERNLMTLEDYEKIAGLEATTDFVTYLKTNRSYAYIFDDYDENRLHRAQIEQLLTNSIHTEFARIYSFASVEQRKALSLVFFRFEVNILKTCLLRVFNHDNTYDLLMFKDFFTAHSKLDVSKLIACSSIEEFINALKGTEYYPLMSKLHSTNHNTYHEYGLQLDIYYFTRVWKLKDRLFKGKNLKVLTSIYGYEIDLLNLLWIYRSKKYFDIDTGKILASIIPINYKLTREQVGKLVSAVSIDEYMKILHTTFYAKLEKSLEAESIEKLYYKIFSQLYQVNCKRYRTSMAPVLYYIYQKERELDLLTTALECIRYKLPPSETLKYIQI